jgi:hypothetical protein
MKKKKLSKKTVAIVFSIFMLGMLLGALLNEYKLNNYKKDKIKFADDLAVCEVIGTEASALGKEVKDMEMNNESIQKFYTFLGISREYFLCVQNVYGFKDGSQRTH